MSWHDSGTRRHADCLGLEGEENCCQCASQGEGVVDCDDDGSSSSSSSSTNITSQVTVNNIAFSHDGLSIVSAGSPPFYHHTSFPFVFYISFPLAHYYSFPLVFSLSAAPPQHSIQHSFSVSNNSLLGTRHLKFWDLSSLNPAASNTALTGTKGVRARVPLHLPPRLTPSLSLPNAAAWRLQHG